MKTKVCLTTLEFPPDVGGVGESVQRIGKMLLDLGYEVHVAVFRAVFRKEKQMAEAGEYCRSNYQTSEQNGIVVHRLLPAVRSTVAQEQDYLCDLYGLLQRLHQKYQFNLFHAFFINEMGFLTTLLARENNLPVINSVRGADLHKHIFNPQQQGQIVWTLENSSWVTCVSRDLMHKARTLVPSIETKSSAFWNSIAPISWEDLPTPSLAEKLKGTVIGSVGRFRDKKGLEYLLDACGRLQKESELTLLLVGDFVAKEKGYWEQEISNSGIENIVITGTISRLEALAYLPYMDIFAIPSLHDGCPNALLEAMFASRAIVGTKVDAIGEILQDRVQGLLVPPYCSDSLESALRELIQQPELRQKLGMAAWKKVSNLNPFVEQQNWEQVYRYALGISASFPILSAV